MSKDHLPQREFESLSAYIDGELRSRAARKLESRLKSDPVLRQTYLELRAVARGMRALPQVRPPRSFILSQEIIGVRQHRSAYPVLRLATVLAAFAFVALVGVDAIAPTFSGAMQARSLDQVAAEAPAMPESEALGAAKAESNEPEALLESQPAEMLAGAEAPAEEAEGEALAMAPEPEATQEAIPIEEDSAADQERAAESQAVGPEFADIPQDATPPTFSATEQPALDSMADQVESDEDLDQATTFTQPERGSSTANFWLRGVEIGLGGLTLFLGALTLWARKRSR